MIDSYQNKLTETFLRFFESGKSSGILLIVCTLISLVLANSRIGNSYLHAWHTVFLGLSIEGWINDGLMAVFFLMIGLELERELYNGELAHFRTALFPAIAALGGVCVPVLIHLHFNSSTPFRLGFAIPMATDIAFALGVLALLGERIPPALKVFMTALAVIDDLLAIIVIGVFYSSGISVYYLSGALAVMLLLTLLNVRFRVMSLAPYLLGGLLMWFFMLKSGVHATIAGVLLAFAIPFSPRCDDCGSPSHRLENALHKPVAFFILPVFALANTGIMISPNLAQALQGSNSIGIMGGLLLGKPLGITCFSLAAVALGICRLPRHIGWRHIVGAGMLGGIGYTMSIFITMLAFKGSPEMIGNAKISILLASFFAGSMGYLWLRYACRRPWQRAGRLCATRGKGCS
jgi:Na+:H+ antiporter, NhaA family